MRLALVSVLLWLSMPGCHHAPPDGVFDLRAGRPVEGFHASLISGSRDGDILHVSIAFTHGTSKLLMRLECLIGVPSTLKSGTYRWDRNGRVMEGSVADRSITFLGGQSGPPSFGGSFQLLSPEGAPLYSVRILTTVLSKPRP